MFDELVAKSSDPYQTAPPEELSGVDLHCYLNISVQIII